MRATSERMVWRQIEDIMGQSFFAGWVTSLLAGLNYPWQSGVVSRGVAYSR